MFVLVFFLICPWLFCPTHASLLKHEDELPEEVSFRRGLDVTCIVDPSGCQAALSNCVNLLGICNSNLADYNTCQSNLTTCNSSLAANTTAYNNCENNLTTCSNNLTDLHQQLLDQNQTFQTNYSKTQNMFEQNYSSTVSHYTNQLDALQTTFEANLSRTIAYYESLLEQQKNNNASTSGGQTTPVGGGSFSSALSSLYQNQNVQKGLNSSLNKLVFDLGVLGGSVPLILLYSLYNRDDIMDESGHIYDKKTFRKQTSLYDRYNTILNAASLYWLVSPLISAINDKLEQGQFMVNAGSLCDSYAQPILFGGVSFLLNSSWGGRPPFLQRTFDFLIPGTTEQVRGVRNAVLMLGTIAAVSAISEFLPTDSQKSSFPDQFLSNSVYALSSLLVTSNIRDFLADFLYRHFFPSFMGKSRIHYTLNYPELAQQEEYYVTDDQLKKQVETDISQKVIPAKLLWKRDRYVLTGAQRIETETAKDFSPVSYDRKQDIDYFIHRQKVKSGHQLFLFVPTKEQASPSLLNGLGVKQKFSLEDPQAKVFMKQDKVLLLPSRYKQESLHIRIYDKVGKGQRNEITSTAIPLFLIAQERVGVIYTKNKLLHAAQDNEQKRRFRIGFDHATSFVKKLFSKKPPLDVSVSMTMSGDTFHLKEKNTRGLFSLCAKRKKLLPANQNASTESRNDLFNNTVNNTVNLSQEENPSSLVLQMQRR